MLLRNVGGTVQFGIYRLRDGYVLLTKAQHAALSVMAPYASAVARGDVVELGMPQSAREIHSVVARPVSTSKASAPASESSAGTTEEAPMPRRRTRSER